MINVHVLNSNNIVTLQGEGKIPIKSSQGFMFYNSNELLCAAVGACIGRQIVIYGTQNKIDITLFESIGVTMDNGIIEIHLQHPKNFNVSELKSVLERCEISQKINMPIKVITRVNDTPDEELVKRDESKPCCGG